MKAAIEALQQQRRCTIDNLECARQRQVENLTIGEKTAASIARREVALREIEVAIVRLGGEFEPRLAMQVMTGDGCADKAVGSPSGGRPPQRSPAAILADAGATHHVPSLGAAGVNAIVAEQTLVSVLRMAGYMVTKL